MQPGAEEGAVVTSGDSAGVVGMAGVGDRVKAGGLRSVHPLTITRIARVNRNTNRGTGVLLAIVLDRVGCRIYFQDFERIIGSSSFRGGKPGPIQTNLARAPHGSLNCKITHSRGSVQRCILVAPGQGCSNECT